MYSRNYATFENVNTARLTTDNKRNISARSPQAIPVKSFSDETAFERFNSLGRTNIVEETPNNINDDSESISRDEPGEVNVESTKETSEGNAVILEPSGEIHNTENSKSNSIFSEFYKLLKLVEGDWFIVVLAVSMLIFGANETNDKLTPIALLAIMFI